MWCHVMKSSDLVSKAKPSAPPRYHPAESPVVGCSDSAWKWPQDGERFQVTTAWNLRHMWKYPLSLISEFCTWSQRAVQNANTALPFFHPAAIESGTSSGIFGALSSPIGMTRRNISYDELMEAPMHSPPSDMSVNILWKDPVIPQHRFRNTTEVHSCLCSRILYLLF